MKSAKEQPDQYTNCSAFFSEDSHFNDFGIMLYVDAILNKQEAELPKCLKDHYATCEKCRSEIFNYYLFRKYISDPEPEKEPNLCRENPDQTS